ncbi:putative endonuclease/exonuclease/phosphatase [Dioscorea sansibarensis]
MSHYFSSSKSNSSCSSSSSCLKMMTLKLRRLCSRLRRPLRRRPKPQVVIQKLNKIKSNGEQDKSTSVRQLPSIRLATFNAAMFSMAPAVPWADHRSPKLNHIDTDIWGKSTNDRPKSILKQQKLASKSAKLRVSINLPDNEISLGRSKRLGEGDEVFRRAHKGKAPLMAHSLSFPNGEREKEEKIKSDRSVLDVLREVGADVFALQNVRAEEEKGMHPLSDLAEGLGMKYIFAESWAPDYGNAILSKWPIKHWKVQKIFDDTDFRNVLKATIEVPRVGEISLHCTHLDHLDENWRMKQIKAILRPEDGPHILLGGLNSLDESDYSSERWNDIIKYYEEIGKPTPKVEVMKFLKSKEYVDAKNYAGECEAVVVVAKGQDVQGTSKYGTRVDYILASPNSPYEFVPGSYGVISSKRTSDHHIVKVDITISNNREEKQKPRVVKIDKNSSRGVWSVNS